METASLMYQIKNHSEKFELETKFLGWFPKGEIEWREELLPKCYQSFPKEVDILDSTKNIRVSILMHEVIKKDNFPQSFFSEERSLEWFNFCIISLAEKPEEKFIIPLY